jgi:hypothetical protein
MQQRQRKLLNAVPEAMLVLVQAKSVVVARRRPPSGAATAGVAGCPLGATMTSFRRGDDTAGATGLDQGPTGLNLV